jgi:hypothetical protein
MNRPEAMCAQSPLYPSTPDTGEISEHVSFVPSTEVRPHPLQSIGSALVPRGMRVIRTFVLRGELRVVMPPQRRIAAGLVMPAANAEAMSLHLTAAFH